MKNENETSEDITISTSQIIEDLNKIEDQIITYFTNSSIRTGRDKIFASILAHFYLRKELTQKELQNLTGYSAGAISEGLKQCLEMNFITEEKQWRKPFKYKMESILEPFIKNFKNVIILYLNKEAEFQEIKNWMSEISIENIPKRSHKIYESLVAYLNNFFKFLDIYKKIKVFLDEKID